MATQSNLVYYPKPSIASFSTGRLIKTNDLLKNQIAQFRELEKQLPPELQTGIDTEGITTEGESSSYVARLTAVLREREYQKLIEKKYTVGLSPQDEIALRDLTNEFSALDEPFYSPLLKRLKSKMHTRG
jgi:hypothetical protein